MAKVILICGKICSGKSCYAKQIKDKENAVILSSDEATFDLIRNRQGEFYNVFVKRVSAYLRKKAVEIALAGTTVILDWGFWSGHDRQEISAFFTENGVPYEWHYIDVTQEQWERQIEERNKRVKDGAGGSDFYVDEGLLSKLLSRFEEPAREDMDVWYVNGGSAAAYPQG